MLNKEIQQLSTLTSQCSKQFSSVTPACVLLTLASVLIVWVIASNKEIFMFIIWALIKSKPCVDCVVVVLQEEFSVQPSDVEVAEGEVAVLNCGPPMGHPEPNVLWKKDGVPINYSDPHYTVSPLPV